MSYLTQLGNFKTAKSGTVYANIDEINDEDLKNTCIEGLNSGSKDPILYNDKWYCVIQRDNNVLIYAFDEDQAAAEKFAAWKPDPSKQRTPQQGSYGKPQYAKGNTSGGYTKKPYNSNKPYAAPGKSKFRTYQDAEEVLLIDTKKQNEKRAEGKQILTPQFVGNAALSRNENGELIVIMGKVTDVEV